jgi:hypothetical protein
MTLLQTMWGITGPVGHNLLLNEMEPDIKPILQPAIPFYQTGNKMPQ